MDDLISRQAAIDAIKNYWKNEVDRIPMESTYFDVYTQIIDSIRSHNAGICKAIDTLPPAQPKHGRWIEENRRPKSSQFYCSECHRIAYDIQPNRAKGWVKRCRYAFCPHCGAMMDEEEQDEQTD